MISLKDVWLKYRIEFKEDGKVALEDFWALKEINIDVTKGETIGIIGENGAGKTSLLKIIAGMLKPDRGTVQVNGTVSTLMEISAGFHKDLTGRENIYLISSLFGLTKDQIDARYNDIVKFAAIGRFINAPVKNYSQGMYMRLAFAIAIHVDPDILLIDDIFVVGDIYAQRKCVNKIFELKEKGLTILFALQELEMLKRICSRGIFLREGVVIKDGPIDKVCSYYTETVGDKKGIAIVQKGPLGIVFNNGKLILRWRDETITCNLSGHCSMLISGREYLSTTADWQLQTPKTDKEIVTIGKWPDIPISQYWRIFFLNEKEFFWEIMIQIWKKIPIEKIDIRIFFIDEYKGWLTLDAEHNFPETFIHEMEGDCTIVNDCINNIVGLKGNIDATKSVPTFIFDRLHDNTKVICQVGNTGSEISGRIIQYQIFSTTSNINYAKGEYNRCFSSKVIIFEPQETKRLKAYLDHTKQIMRETTIIHRDQLSVCCKDNKIEIYWQDKLLTCGIGLNTKFRCQNRDYSALNGHWNICKQNSYEIVITISWDDKPPFIQIWTLKLQTNDIILWEVEMRINEKVRLRNKQVELMLSEEYREWFTTDKMGDFQRLERKGNAVLLDNYIHYCIGLESAYKSEELILPGLLFKYEDDSPKSAYIFKLNGNTPATLMRFLEIDRKENVYTSPENHKYFNGEIRLVTNKEARNELIKISDKNLGIIKRSSDSFGEIEHNKISLRFDYGKGRIFWDGMELTKELGLYSSVFFRDIWFDSTQAFWKVQKVDREKLVAVGHWPWVPLIQTWEICILDEETLFLKIIKEIWEDVILEREQVNLMLSDRYKEWFVHGRAHGKFPERFSEHDGIFWDRLWCGSASLPIKIKKCKFNEGILRSKFLPSIVFSCSEDYQVRYSVIENTDDLFQARILQYELVPEQAVAPDKNKYFEGRIKVST